MEDFNIPSEERIVLLGHLQEAIGGAPPHFWAACQICDLKSLERLVKCGREYPEILIAFAQQTSIIARYWGPYPAKAQSQSSTPKKSTPSNLNSSPSTPPAKRLKTSDSPVLLRRNRQVRELAKERDKSICVLTGDAMIEVAHIYPHHSIKHQEEDILGQRHIFWNHLKNFWPKEKVATWEAQVFPAGIHEFGVEKVCNLITLSNAAHRGWGQGAFALKPISESNDKMTLEVQFFWQKKQTDGQTMSLLTTPFSTEGLDQNIGTFEGGATRLHKPDDTRIQSGDYFKLQTDDPETNPLPSFQLLEMQWFLQRILGMAGAVDVDWPSWSELDSDISDEEIPYLELEEVGDTSLLSSQSLSSPAKLVRNDEPSLSVHPKHHIEQAEGNGNGDRLELQE